MIKICECRAERFIMDVPLEGNARVVRVDERAAIYFFYFKLLYFFVRTIIRFLLEKTLFVPNNVGKYRLYHLRMAKSMWRPGCMLLDCSDHLLFKTQDVDI